MNPNAEGPTIEELYENGKFQDVADRCVSLISSSEADEDIWYIFIRALTNLGEAQEAIDAGNESLRQFPEHPELHSALAQAYLSADSIDGKERTLMARDHLFLRSNTVPRQHTIIACSARSI